MPKQNKDNVDRTKKRAVRAVVALFCIASFPNYCSAQEVPNGAMQSTSPIQLRPQRLTLVAAIELAKRNYPTIRTAAFKADAAKEGITQAKTAYIPRADFLLDENYGTANNITGFLAPQNIVPNISGQVKNGNNFLGGFGFITGTLVSWQPFDFGLRKAEVSVAQSATKQAQSAIAVSELDAMTQTADAFLSLLAAQQVEKAAQAKVERMQVFLNAVRILAQRQIRPITDQYLAEAELVRAKDESIAAEQNYKIALAALVKWTGIQSDTTEVEPGALLKQIPENHFRVADPYTHPQAIAQQASIDTIRAQKQAIERSYYPQLFLRFPIYARGSSYQPDLSLNFGQGYYPTKLNYAISAYMTFPAMDIFMLRSQRRAAAKNEAAEQSRLDEIVLNLKQQDAQSQAMIEGALRIANNAPTKVKAAQEAFNSANVRYQYQLATVNDVAQNSQIFTQAQVDYATAQLQVWRALLATAAAHGDMRPFIDEARRASMESK